MIAELIRGLGGGSYWFLLGTRTSELSTEVVGGELIGAILESRGFSFWIRFRERILHCLLERAEACYMGDKSLRYVKVWEDWHGKFGLECHSNEVGSYQLL